MLAYAEKYWLEIKQLPFCFTASSFSAAPSPAEPQTARTVGRLCWTDEQLWLNLFWEKKKSPEAIDKQEAEVSVKEE